MPTLLEQIAGDDLDAVFDTEMGFAEKFEFNGTVVGGLTLIGIFDRGYQDTHPLIAEVDVEPNTMLVRTSETEKVRPKDEVVIDLVTYEVVGIVPNGTGITNLTLNEIRDDG